MVRREVKGWVRGRNASHSVHGDNTVAKAITSVGGWKEIEGGCISPWPWQPPPPPAKTLMKETRKKRGGGEGMYLTQSQATTL